MNTNEHEYGARRVTVVFVCGALALSLAAVVAQTPAAPASNGPVLTLTAAADNVSGAPAQVRISLLRWSTPAERDELLAAWTNPGPPARAAGRGKAAEDPFGAGNDAPTGGAGRGKAGRGRGGDTPPPAKPTPEGSLTTALGKAPTVGYVWSSSEVAGYSIRYAVKLSGSDSGERIILVTDRRLGSFNDLWKPTGAGAADNYEFSVIELHLNAKEEGEGKSSLTGKVGADSAAKTLALENYAAAPVILKGVKRATN